MLGGLERLVAMGSGDHTNSGNQNNNRGNSSATKNPADCNSNHVGGSSGSRVIMPVPKLNHERRHSHSPSTGTSSAASTASSILDLSNR